MTKITCFVCFLLLSAAQSQQQLPPGTASVSGVVEALGGGAIPGAAVEMRRIECGNFAGAADVLTTTTDMNGKFAFNAVRAGNWCLGAAIAGGKYSPVEYLQHGYKGRGATIAIGDGQKLDNLRLSMPQTGVISGRVVNAEGEPMGRVRVEAMEAFYQNGQRRLYALNLVQTNDLGEYSLFWLPPGEYFVAAMPENPDRPEVVFSVAPPGMGGHRSDAMPPVITRRIRETGELIEETFMPVYYGGGADPQNATAIKVEPGATVKVDLSFAGASTRAWHIRGRVVSATNGQGVAGAQLRLAPRQWSATVIMPYASADANGAFDIPGVAPGSYDLYATGSVRQQPVAPPPVPPVVAAGLTVGEPEPVGEIPPEYRRAIELYLLQAGNLGGAQLVGRVPVEMGSASIDNLVMTLAPPYALSGRFTLEGSAASIPPAALRGIRIALTREPDVIGAPQLSVASTATTALAQAGGNAGPAAGDPGVFRIQGIGPGTYRLYANPFFAAFQWGTPSVPADLRNIYVKSVRFGPSDVLADGLELSTAPEYPLEVTLAGGGRLSGTVVDDRQGPVMNGVIALVPDMGRRQRPDLYRTARTDASGGFQIQGIPPGDYKVFAWEDVADGAWQSPEFIRSYEQSGKPVQISPDTEARENVVVIPARR